MDNKCPKCGEKLSVFYLKETCPKCGAKWKKTHMPDLRRY